MQTRDRIAVAMANTMRQRGYAGSGIKQILHDSGVPNGSLYHHFRGKSQVAALALRQLGKSYQTGVTRQLAEAATIEIAIEGSFIASAEWLAARDWINMCPVATVAGEVADSEPELRAVAAEVFDMWIASGADVLHRRGLSESDANALMNTFIAALEGAFILARTQRSGEPLLAAGRLLGLLVAALPRIHEDAPVPFTIPPA